MPEPSPTLPLRMTPPVARPSILRHRPVRYHRLVGHWTARHPGRSWLDEDFDRSLESRAGRNRERRRTDGVPGQYRPESCA